MREETQNSMNLKLIMFFDPESDVRHLGPQSDRRRSIAGIGQDSAQRPSRINGRATFSPQSGRGRRLWRSSCGCRACNQCNPWPFRAGTQQPETTTLTPNVLSVIHKNPISQKLEVPHAK